MSNRGFFGVAIFQPKCEPNLGTTLRNAFCFDAAFIATIGHRYHRQITDTPKTPRHIPLFHYDTMEDFLAHRPHDCEIVRVEVDGKTTLGEFTHKPRAIYLFGGEDRSVPLGVGERSLRMETRACLNLAVATGIVMHDRTVKGVKT